ncbi:MAG: prephenate dehydratase [Deltaproteobacteria bacterium]|nr:prephenate dehydratase [Deltaproteobacteria bacterium]
MIDKLRKKINAIDMEILRLLNSRAEIVIQVGHAKLKANKEIYSPERERDVYARILSAGKGPFPASGLKNVFREIMSASLSLERPLKIAFLGPEATFTHQACLNTFGSSASFVPKKNIAEVFDDVEKDRAELGVVPIENTTEGVVSHTLDLLVTSDLKICAEIMLEVSLALMNKTGRLSDVGRVSSHPNPLAQSRNWLKANLFNAEITELTSTARAAQAAAEDGTGFIAAIASEAAAKLYNLKIIERGIEDSANNFTRFLVIGKKESRRTGADKTSLVFAVKDAPGALFTMLEPFAKRRINLTKIESRPMKTRAWEYIFFVDLDGHVADKKVRDAISELEESCTFLKALGSYPRSK